MGKGKTTLLVVIALAILGLLIYLGSEQPNISPTDTSENGDQPAEQVDNTDSETSNTEATEDEIEVAEEDVVNQLPKASFNISGEIIAVNSNSITIQSDGSHMEAKESVQIIVNITDNTTLVDAKNDPISISYFSEGMQVSVEASGNIKNRTEVEASSIKTSE